MNDIGVQGFAGVLFPVWVLCGVAALVYLAYRIYGPERRSGFHVGSRT